MGDGQRGLALGTVSGALVGVMAFFLVGWLRLGAGDDIVLALAWGLAALVGLVILGRVVDAVLWWPALQTPVEEAGLESEGDEATTPTEVQEPSGAEVDVVLDDDTDSLRGPQAGGEPVDVPRAA
jgi:hypothetical protein